MCKFFVVLNFHSKAHQRNLLTINMSRITNELLLCHGPWHTDRFQSVLVGCISCTARASSQLRLSIRAPPDSLRQYLAKERRETEIFWDGESIYGLEESQKDRERSTHEFSTLYTWLTVMLISGVNKFRVLNFCG